METKVPFQKLLHDDVTGIVSEVFLVRYANSANDAYQRPSSADNKQGKDDVCMPECLFFINFWSNIEK